MELPKMWLIQLFLMFCCFYVSSSFNCHDQNVNGGIYTGCNTTCFESVDASFVFQNGYRCLESPTDRINTRFDTYRHCTGENCNNQFKGDKRKKLKCYGKDKEVDGCDMCKWSSISGEIGCHPKESKSERVENSTHNYFVCYGNFCNTNEKEKWRKCYVGEYGDCEWAFDSHTSYGLKETACDQWHAQNICVHQVWTHNANSSRVCHRYLCHHQVINHGYDLVHKQLPDLNATSEMNDIVSKLNVTVKQCVTKDNQNCFKIEPPPKIKCYVSENASLGSLEECGFFVTRCRLTRSKSTRAVTSRGCSPTNRHIFDDSKEMQCYDTTTADYEECHFLGDSSNNLPADKNCWTGIEGDCKAYFNEEIGQAFFHKPKETYCHGWDKYCYKAVFNGTCTWYDCNRFSNNHFYQQENIQYNYTRPKDNAIVFPVDHHRCSGENCNTPKDSANDLGSNLALMLLAIGLLNVLE